MATEIYNKNNATPIFIAFHFSLGTVVSSATAELTKYLVEIFGTETVRLISTEDSSRECTFALFLPHDSTDEEKYSFFQQLKRVLLAKSSEYTPHFTTIPSLENNL